jgi:hypothetical protein
MICASEYDSLCRTCICQHIFLQVISQKMTCVKIMEDFSDMPSVASCGLCKEFEGAGSLIFVEAGRGQRRPDHGLFSCRYPSSNRTSSIWMPVRFKTSHCFFSLALTFAFYSPMLMMPPGKVAPRFIGAAFQTTWAVTTPRAGEIPWPLHFVGRTAFGLGPAPLAPGVCTFFTRRRLG